MFTYDDIFAISAACFTVSPGGFVAERYCNMYGTEANALKEAIVSFKSNPIC